MSLHTINRVWCKIMIQRYLGVWLDNNLSFDQLSIELSNGSLELECLDINTRAVSAALAAGSIPLKLVDGYVGKIRIEIPWVRIMTDPTRMSIEDLQLTFRGADVVKLDDMETITSMIESVLMSLSTDDMARSVFDEVSKENSITMDFKGNEETADSFSGIINAVWSRFCLTVHNLTLRFENEPKNKSEMATAVEIHVQKITFMDEQMRSCEMDHTNATDLVTTQPHGVGSTTNLNKNLTFHGVSIHTDVFSEIANDGNEDEILITSMHIRREKAKQMSPTKSVYNSSHPDMFQSAMSDMDAFHSCYDKLTQESTSPDQLETLRTAPAEPELFSNPIKCGEVIGDISCVFRIKNAANDVNVADIEESKIETDIFVKGLNLFATASQIEIIKRYFLSITTPKGIIVQEQGKPMSKEDYENMTKNMEPNQTPEAPISVPTFGGNWNAGEEFKEFENAKSLKQKEKEKSEKEKFKTLKANSNVKEEFTVRTHIGTLLAYIPHCDYMSSDYARQHGGYGKVLEALQKESKQFFMGIQGFSFLSKHGLANIRQAAEAFYPKDHLRIIGGSLAVTSSSSRIGTVDTFSCRINATHFDMLEYLTPESAPGHNGPLTVNILDYSNQENVECDPNFKMVLRTSTEKKGETKIDVLLGAVRSELDFSIIDRISNLIICKPFFDDESEKGAQRNKVPQLKDDLYAEVNATEDDAKSKTLFNLVCPNWQVDLRIPKADLRDPTGSRLPFSQRHVHNEYLSLGIKEIDVSIPIGKDVSFIEILCSEMFGDFCGEGLNIPKEQQRVLYASKNGFDKINLKLALNGNTKIPGRDSTSSSIPESMLKSVSADIMMAHPKKEGPFSKVPRSYMSHDGEEKEEIIQAGTRREILSFQKDCEDFASTFMLFTIPVLKLHIPEKSFLEILYNRLVNDLALFQPAAPAFRAEADAVINAQPVESFQECVSPKNYAESEHSESDDDALTLKESVDSIDFDRDVPHTFVMTLNAKKCAILCNTSIKEDEKAPEAAQVSLDLEKVHIGTTAGYHGDINHTYFHFTSSKAAVGSVDALKGVQIPNVISAKDFGKWNKDLNQLEYVLATDELSSGSTEDAFAVALHMNFKPDVNVKDVLVGIAIRNSQLQAKPFKNWGAFWITQLSELFTLQDYAIPGYVLPTVSTDLHICLENAIIGYDHSWINPSSKLKLRAALGHCNLASSIVSDMNISKTLCIFESCRLYMSHDSLKDAVRFEGYGAPKAPTKKFIPFLDFGSVQLDILFAVGEETGSRTTPAFEIRCQNDIINAWACADSLATFIQTVMEYTSHGQVPVKTPAEEETDELEKSIKNEDIAKSVAGESVWSDASTGSKHIQKMGVGAALPDDVEKRLQAMIREAVDENDESAGIAIGEDAVKEFTMTKPKPKKPSRKPSKNMEDPTRNYTITDEEFCMVDDNVFGSGITNLPGESRVRSMTAKNKYDEPPLTKQDFFHSIEESGNDGLYQTMSGNWTPALRYFLKDVTLRLSLYAGNDLSTTPSPIRTYCTEEYRNGYGPEQKIEKNSAGGPNRDHSAFVVLELNRITYLKQVFEKNAPLLSTSLFQIGDVVIKDCVKASTIQEMLYQYSVVNQPRRGSAPIFSVRIAESQSKEGKMRVSMLPIKINVDQDTMEFLIEFFEETSRLLDLPKNQMNPLIQRPVIEVPAEPSSRKTSPKTSVSSSEGDVAPRMYPSIPEPAMTLEPLQPSPVQPATPLGDLSYLEKISSNHQSPVKRPIIDAPLTASAVSIGRIFESPKNEVDDEPVDPIQIEEMGNFNINEELRRINELGKSKSSPLFNDSESESSDEEDETNTDFVVPHTSQHQKLHESFDPAHPADLSDLAGDWADDNDSIDHFTAHTENDHYHNSKTTKCEELQSLNLMDEEESGKGSMNSPMPSSPLRSARSVKRELPPLKMPQQPLSNDDILLRSTMMGSIHPTQSVHNLVDTSDDLEEHSNFLDGLDDDEDEEKQKVEEEMEEEQKKEEEERDKEIQEAVERGETFFKQFVFSPSVNIYVDYQGKRKITMEKQGAIVGLLMAFGQLNQMPITLKKINTRTGLLGSGRCMQHAIGEWSGDMLTNMPSVIASYGPISPLVQIGRGVVDLFWMPVSEFRKNDGNVMKGVQRGVGSFSVSSAAGIVGMAQTVTGFVQSLAEMTMNEIKPDDPSTRRSRRYNRHHGTNPTDVRHSLQLAYGILYDGYHQTRDDLELAAQEDRASGNSVVRSAFRYAVPTFLGPIVMATQVTYQLLGGLRNQLRPDTYQDERRKWGEKDVPGGVNK